MPHSNIAVLAIPKASLALQTGEKGCTCNLALQLLALPGMLQYKFNSTRLTTSLGSRLVNLVDRSWLEWPSPAFELGRNEALQEI